VSEPFHVRDILWQAMPDGPEKYQAYLCSREWAERKEAVKKRCGGICERCHTNPAEHRGRFFIASGLRHRDRQAVPAETPLAPALTVNRKQLT
jgi:hypothetical protein